MPPVYIYSDESSGRDQQHGILSLAGVAISANIWAVRNSLLKAERDSGKGDRDWHSTKDPKVRRRYLQAVLEIDGLNGCAFQQVYEQPINAFKATVDTLTRVVKRLGGDGPVVIIHEGYSKATRRELQRRLRDETGIQDLTVEAGDVTREPRVRLADALAGFSRLMQLESATKDVFSDLPYEGWFVDLE